MRAETGVGWSLGGELRGVLCRCDILNRRAAVVEIGWNECLNALRGATEGMLADWWAAKMGSKGEDGADLFRDVLSS